MYHISGVLFVIMTSYNMLMCFMTCDALPLGLLTCYPCDCCIHTPIACSPYIYINITCVHVYY